MIKISRRIVSSPFVLINAIRKSRIDNFVGGLIFGAIFSLFVNILTVGIQEKVHKQRILEAVEWEIYNNSAEAGSIIDQAEKVFERKEKPSPFYSSPKYSDDVWRQSTEPMQYIAQLPPETQGQVVVYYSVIVSGHNELSENNKAYFGKLMQDCYPIDGYSDEQIESNCKLYYYQLVKNDLDSASSVFKSSHEVLDVFHPTQDRLNSWFLRLMMGDQSVKVLSRE